MVAVDTRESKPDGGSVFVEAGDYHWMIDEVEAVRNDYGLSLQVVMSVLNGTTAGQHGRKQKEFYACQGEYVDKLRKLLVATEMMTDQQWVERIGQPLEFDERLLKGRQLCGRIKWKPYKGDDEKHKGKDFPSMGYDIWSVWDERAKLIPKDPECMAMLTPPPGYKGNGTPANQQSQPQTQTQPSQQQTTPATQAAPQQQPAAAASPAGSKFNW